MIGHITFLRKKRLHFGNVLFLEFVSLDNSRFVIYINVESSTSGGHIYLNLYILK